MVTYFLTHPEVRVQPDVPVTDWSLSSQGRLRLSCLLGQPWVSALRRIVASREEKAVETAVALAGHRGLMPTFDPELGENDRSATGYLPPIEFETVANEFFARPDQSVRGWETAIAAQHRITAAVARAVEGSSGDTAVVSHGGVGTLLMCDLLCIPIDRRHDQPGQGSYFSFDFSTRQVRHGWRRLEPVTGVGGSGDETAG